MVDIVEKIVTQTQPKPKKPAKEETKEKLCYSIRAGNSANEDDGEAEEVKKEQFQTDAVKTMRVRQLKKNIQDEQNIKDKVTLKLYLNGEEITDDKLSIEDANLLQGGNIEVEITQKVSIEVQGKGKGY